ncbi:helix-turn-helix domain-containing protein [Enterococcus sp. DIV0242_7C1]|uniref:HTH cro/C1-type domain-containing protein n=1 Tax=Candidatus Enterococcus dunnyi TaxID=1834192 RepID=A0A200J226_9ENTE|nr:MULTISPECIES: helix-turn-helix domain-containing protein [unclassified Enterococcus]MBO0470138.1 helix-turn-helix domain-containing protein [Enterococcus sp. DIV0242_7C1]OUZ30595.1 hypothetical protein A5889_002883 [Enterococcus sp. 9D6_DIV0238]
MLVIGKKIRELRQAKKMTQKDLAKILNVTPQAVSKWERGESNPDIQILIHLSQFFHVSVDEIIGNKNKHFLDSIFSKMKGSKQMGKTVQKTSESKLAVNVDVKTVIIFDMVFSFIADKGLIQTQALNRKLNMLMKQKGKAIVIETYNSNQVDQYGSQADVILLTPTFGYAKEEIAKKFPKISVIGISKKEYGLLDVEKLYEKIIKALKI